MEQIHYASNGTDDFDPEVKVSPEKVEDSGGMNEALAYEAEQLLTFPNATRTIEAMKAIQAQYATIQDGLKKSIEVAVEDEGDCQDDTCDGSGYYQDENGKNVPCLHTVEARGDEEKDRDY